uniref:NADH-ubiquinone oxidoreductase chain 6 n=1 Tax=Ophioplocus japonicus TaxID=35056 RepID=A0A513X085_9ECHI|nr:NADH dehydrogenase subunit 6 [Ophioplocus japonicus]QDH07344.1 NADH dehydrogenase subunit 6 [Ophioplocus japonicus]
MLYMLFLLVLGGVLLLVFSSSPFFGVFGILVQALSFSILLCLYGSPFFGLLVILIYIGGMMVVFLFSTILSAERYPSIGVWEAFLFWFGLGVLICPLVCSWKVSLESMGFLALELEAGSFGEIFGSLSVFTCLVAVVLLVALMVVLTFGFEHSRGSLRKL